MTVPAMLSRQLGLALLYGLTPLLMHRLLPSYGYSFFLAGGVALAAMLIGGRRYFWGLLLGGFAACSLLGDTPATALFTSFTAALGAWSGAWLIRRGNVFDEGLSSVQDLLRIYFLGGMAGALVSAAAAIVRPEALADSWMASSLSVVLLTPLILKCWPVASRPFILPGATTVIETLLCFGLMALVGAMVFLDYLWHSLPMNLHDTIRGYLMFLFITWTAIRLGSRASSFAVLLSALLAIAGAERGIGFFANDQDFSHLGSYWLYAFTLALVGMVLSIYIEAAKTAEQQLAMRQSDLSQELKHITAAIDHHALVAITDARGRITHVNANYFAICGYTREELLGQDFRLLNSGRHSREFWQDMYGTINDGKIWHGEICNRAKDGSLYWVQTTISPFSGKNGVIYVTLRTDITEQKRFEQELQTQRDFHERISETLGVGLYVQDAEGRCTYLNSEAERLLGWPRAEFIGKPVHDTIHTVTATGDALPVSECIITRNNRNGLRVNARDQVFVRRDGAVFPVSVVSQGIFQDGAYLGAVVSFQDIGASKRDELELKMHRDSLQVLVQQKTADLERSMAISRRALAELIHQKFVLDQHAIVTVSDAEGNITYGNDKFCETSGYAWDEFIGKNHRLLRSGLHSAEFYQSMYQTLERGEVWRAEVCNRAKNGQLYWLDTTIASFVGEDGKLLERIAVRTDITARKLAQEAAFAANSAKSEFLANMSHEIRTPMNGVVGMVDILQQSQLTPEQHRMLNTIQDSSLALLHILNDILDFSKIEAGKLAMESVPTRLRDVAEEVALLMATMANAKLIDLSLFISPKLPNWISSDPVRLRQILFNLLGNAVKFTTSEEARPGKVSLFVEPCQLADGSPGIQMRIADNGIGMDEQTLAKLFQPFTQADESTARKFGGSGLGLSITRRLTSMMGGQITVSSTPGAGTEFSVTLPLHAPKMKLMPVYEPSLEGVQILFVSRDATAAQIVRDYCVAAGAELTLQADLAAYQPAPGSQRPRVLLLDMDVAAPDQPEGVCIVRLVRNSRNAPTGEIAITARPLLYQELVRAVAMASGRSPVVGKQHDYLYRSSFKDNTAADLTARHLLLLAEDNETNREVMQEQLRMLGYAVEMAGDGVQALKMWRSGSYSLLLTDCHMPNMDGFELTAAIRQAEAKGAHMPIIAVTANAMHGESGRCLACGMDDYLAKPLRLNELKLMLHKWLPMSHDVTNGHGNLAAPDNETRHARFPLPTPPPQAGEGEDESLREFHVKQTPPEVELAALPAKDALEQMGGNAQAAEFALWDAAVMPRLLGNKPEMIRRMLDKFLIHSEEQVRIIAAAAASGETGLVAETAHKLKSGARTVGAMQLGELCQDMENAGEAGDGQTCSALMGQLNTAYAAAAAAIRAQIQ